MTQFASTLYPQTNPTNRILLEFREIHSSTGNDLWTDAYLFSSGMFEDTEAYYGNRAQWSHVMDVLIRIQSASRLAALTG